MAYRVLIARSAEKDLNGLQLTTRLRVSEKMPALRVDSRPPGSIKLEGEGLYRLRVGAYRIIYTISDRERTVTVVAVGHRSEIYR